MNFSALFIQRPVATTLLTVAVGLAGTLAYFFLPVSPLPQVDFPTIQVQGRLPGASPETMASSVATPLERQFGRIAGITEMTSSSSLGSTSVVLQFDLNRNIDAAARDVQAAINAARSQLPPNLPSNPSYKKVNPADAPVLMLALTSDFVERARIYDLASSVLQQKLSQVDGVGEVDVGGGALPAVRVDANPTILNHYGLGLEDLRAVLNRANANRPKGALADDKQTWWLSSTDQLLKADAYRPLIITYRNGGAVRVGDVATVTDSVEDIRTGGLANGKPAVLLIVYREPGANIIDTVDRVMDILPLLRASIPPTVKLSVVLNATTTIRASVRDVEFTLLISLALVILVVFLFLRNGRSTLIPSIAVPVSLLGTFGGMYLLGYSLDNLSLMALTIATGFVVDDAIVVIENITRHLEQGMAPLDAALLGAKEIGFTVDVHQHFFDRGFHPDSDDGRHRRPAVPRVRRDLVIGDRRIDARVANFDADDVRHLVARPQSRAPRPLLSRRRAAISMAARKISIFAHLGAAPSAAHACGYPADHGRNHRSICHRPQGLLPAAGHGAHLRLHRRRSRHVVPVHAWPHDGLGEYSEKRSRGRCGDGVQWRRFRQSAQHREICLSLLNR